MVPTLSLKARNNVVKSLFSFYKIKLKSHFLSTLIAKICNIYIYSNPSKLHVHNQTLSTPLIGQLSVISNEPVGNYSIQWFQSYSILFLSSLRQYTNLSQLPMGYLVPINSFTSRDKIFSFSFFKLWTFDKGKGN